MPEIAELEAYRVLAQNSTGRQICEIDAEDPFYLKRGLTVSVLRDCLVDRRFIAVRRVGKFLTFDVGGHELGLHFGMAGHLLVDGRDAADFDASISHIRETWDPLVVHFSDGGELRVRDRRRLGGVFLDPDLSHLGPDALGLTTEQLAGALTGGRAPVKVRLLDQDHLAGVGNLMADEALWRAGIAPTRPAGSLNEAEVLRLHQGLHDAVTSSIRRGATGGGVFDSVRHYGASCPMEGHPLSHRRIGGRTSWFCPAHQH